MKLSELAKKLKNETGNGLYLIERAMSSKWNDFGHSLILDIGNVANSIDGDDNHIDADMVYHMSKTKGFTPQTVYECERDSLGPNDYTPVSKKEDTQEGISNIYKFVKKNNTNYSAFFNNCEHFASFVMTGKEKSATKQGLLVTAGVIGLVITNGVLSIWKPSENR